MPRASCCLLLPHVAATHYMCDTCGPNAKRMPQKSMLNTSSIPLPPSLPLPLPPSNLPIQVWLARKFGHVADPFKAARWHHQMSHLIHSRFWSKPFENYKQIALVGGGRKEGRGMWQKNECKRNFCDSHRIRGLDSNGLWNVCVVERGR